MELTNNYIAGKILRGTGEIVYIERQTLYTYCESLQFMMHRKKFPKPGKFQFVMHGKQFPIEIQFPKAGKFQSGRGKGRVTGKKKEQQEREARLKFEKQLEIERQARAEENIRREREQREYNERVLKEQLAREQFKARPENQFIIERTKSHARKVEGQHQRRLNEKEQEREKERKGLLNIRSEGSGKAIKQREGDHINSPINAQVSVVCVGEVNLGGEPQTIEQLMRQQTQSDNIVLDSVYWRRSKDKLSFLVNNLAHNTYSRDVRLGEIRRIMNRKRLRKHPKRNQCRKLKALNKYPRHIL
ncbi:uncharacterized protein LOC113342186 [Papaver somniferum]|uniref:uncharacterized protein LOC113342186 n=1 Tax=Papaver somniferum TaxID=3469 RepID=UPI000E70159E|nr:uncharacterized protein LOC113342186 [Papaver somniferum]